VRKFGLFSKNEGSIVFKEVFAFRVYGSSLADFPRRMPGISTRFLKDSGCVEFSPDRLFQVGVYGFGNVLLEIRENPETFKLLENTEKNGIELEGLMVAVYNTVRTKNIRLPLKDQSLLEKKGCHRTRQDS